MKLINSNHVQLSVANLRALVAEIDRKEREGRTVAAYITKMTSDGAVTVSVVADSDHYSEQELADRLSPYLPPEAWAGVR